MGVAGKEKAKRQPWRLWFLMFQGFQPRQIDVFPNLIQATGLGQHGLAQAVVL